MRKTEILDKNMPGTPARSMHSRMPAVFSSRRNCTVAWICWVVLSMLDDITHCARYPVIKMVMGTIRQHIILVRLANGVFVPHVMSDGTRLKANTVHLGSSWSRCCRFVHLLHWLVMYKHAAKVTHTSSHHQEPSRQHREVHCEVLVCSVVPMKRHAMCSFGRIVPLLCMLPMDKQS